MQLSSLGLGTYLGAPDAATDQAYTAAALAFAGAGGNVFDTAANYRSGRSEWALGEAFKAVPETQRFISTKAGYLPMGDFRIQESPRDWFNRVLAEPGILNPGDVVDGCHAMTPRYLRHQVGLSRVALSLDHIDLFHLHNPEQQRPTLGPDAFRAMMRVAFEACEALVQDGLIGAYGCATWNGFRVPPDVPEHLSLEELLDLAQDVAGSAHHFRWVQLPLNLAMPEAFVAPTQRFGGREVPLLQAAQEAGLHVQVSASLMQAQLLRQIPPALGAALGVQSPAQAALQFVRSVPGVTVALCGMCQVAHVEDNLAVLALPKSEPDVLRELVK